MAITLGDVLVLFKGDTKDLDQKLAQSKGEVQGWASSIKSFAGNAFSTAAGFVGAQIFQNIAGGIANVAGQMVTGNAEFERYNTQFGVLLGSSEAAQERIADLADFGARTPFELPEVVRADKILQAFGLHAEDAAERFGFSGEQIRTIAGDTAAGTGASFEEISTYLGKFSSGATGEAIARMQELGIVTRSQLTEMGLEFSKSGQLLSPLDESMGVLLQAMEGKFGGMMDAQSSTLEGMVSNFQDWIGATTRTLGAPIFDMAKSGLGALLTVLSSDVVKRGIEGIAAGIASLTAPVTAFAGQLGEALQTVADVVADDSSGGGSVLQKLYAIQDALEETPFGPFAAGVADAAAAVSGLVQFIQGAEEPLGDWSSWWESVADLFGGQVADVVMGIASFFDALRQGEDLSGAADWLLEWDGVRDLLHWFGVGTEDARNFFGWLESLGPQIVSAWGQAVDLFGQVRDWLGENIPAAIQALQDAAGPVLQFLLEHWESVAAGVGAVVAVLGAAGLGAAIAGAGAAIAAAAAPIVAALAAINLPLVAIAAVAALLAVAWTENWGDIQGQTAALWAWLQPVLADLWTWLSINIPAAMATLSAFWTGTLLPVLTDLWNWLSTNIPAALQALSNFWTGTLLPAIQSVSDWFTGTLFPTLQSLYDTIATALTSALQTLSNIWTGTLLPAIQGVWGWMNGTLFPFLRSLRDFIDAVFGLAVRVFAGVWENVLKPALLGVWSAISGQVMPVFNAVSGFINNTFKPATTALAQAFDGPLKAALMAVQKFLDEKIKPAVLAVAALFSEQFHGALKVVGDIIDATILRLFAKVAEAINGITTALQGATTWLGSVAEKLNALQLPDWLTPGSPTPLEWGLRGITDALRDVNGQLPQLAGNLTINAVPVGAPGSAGPEGGSTTVYNLTNQYRYTSDRTAGDDLRLLSMARS